MQVTKTQVVQCKQFWASVWWPGSRKLAPGDTLLIRQGLYEEPMIHGDAGFVFHSGKSMDATSCISTFNSIGLAVSTRFRSLSLQFCLEPAVIIAAEHRWKIHR